MVVAIGRDLDPKSLLTRYTANCDELRSEGASSFSEAGNMGLDAWVVRTGDAGKILACFANERLGNIEAIAYVREELSAYLSSKSVMLTRVLYSVSHTGDSLEVELVRKLREEIKSLPKNLSPTTERFLNSLSNLVDAALENDLPIDF